MNVIYDHSVNSQSEHWVWNQLNICSVLEIIECKHCNCGVRWEILLIVGIPHYFPKLVTTNTVQKIGVYFIRGKNEGV